MTTNAAGLPVTSALAALALAGAAVAAAPSAHAASTVTFCFRWTEDRQPVPTAGPPGGAYAKLPVVLMQTRDGKAVQLRKARTGADGCGAFAATPTDRPVWVRAAYVQDTESTDGGPRSSARYRWGGRTPQTAGASTGAADLGTGTVKLLRAISSAGPMAPPP